LHHNDIGVSPPTRRDWLPNVTRSYAECLSAQPGHAPPRSPGSPSGRATPARRHPVSRRTDAELVIPGLQGSPTHQLSAEVYQRHHDIGTGLCTVCGQRTPCPARRRAASVIQAAGEDPRWYDARPYQGEPSPAGAPGPGEARGQERSHPGGNSLPYSGYRVSGRTRPLGSEGFFYERDID
jgi:hypothetical protein